MLLWTTTVNAVDPFEMSIPVMCGDKDNIITGIKETYGEDLMFITAGENADGDLISHSLWVNMKTTTWSFLVVNKEKDLACLVASGDKFQVFVPYGLGESI